MGRPKPKMCPKIYMARLNFWSFAIRSWHLPKFPVSVKVHIFWEGHKILRNLHLAFDCTTYMLSKVRWRFHKILWSSQNIWTLFEVWRDYFFISLFQVTHALVLNKANESCFEKLVEGEDCTGTIHNLRRILWLYSWKMFFQVEFYKFEMEQ